MAYHNTKEIFVTEMGKRGYNLTSMLNKGNLNAFESARLILFDVIEQREKGKGFLSEEERQGIVNNPHKDNEIYIKLINLGHEIELNLSNATMLLLNFKIHSLEIEGLLDRYLATGLQDDLISYIEYIDKYREECFTQTGKKEEKLIKELKEKITGIIPPGNPVYLKVFLEAKKEGRNLNFDDLNYKDISIFKKKILNLTESRIRVWQNLLAFYDIIKAASDILGIDYYFKKITSLTQEMKEINNRVEIKINWTHRFFKIITEFQKKEAEKPINLAVYKALDEVDRKIIDEIYPSFKIEPVWINDDIKVGKLYKNKQYKKLAETIAGQALLGWYANIHLEEIKTYGDGDIEENALKWIKDGKIEETDILSISHPDLIERWQSLKKKLKPTIKVKPRKLVSYDNFLTKCLIKELPPLLDDDFENLKDSVMSLKEYHGYFCPKPQKGGYKTTKVS